MFFGSAGLDVVSYSLEGVVSSRPCGLQRELEARRRQGQGSSLASSGSSFSLAVSASWPPENVHACKVWSDTATK